MIDLSEILYDPDLSQQFTVHRRQNGRWVDANWVEDEVILTFTGVVVPANSKEIMQLPEGDRSTAVMVFYSDQEMYVTRSADPGEGFGQGTSDQVEWRQDRYRVVKTNQFGDYGYYAAYAVYMEGY